MISEEETMDVTLVGMLRKTAMNMYQSSLSGHFPHSTEEAEESVAKLTDDQVMAFVCCYLPTVTRWDFPVPEQVVAALEARGAYRTGLRWGRN